MLGNLGMAFSFIGLTEKNVFEDSCWGQVFDVSKGLNLFGCNSGRINDKFGIVLG